MKDSSYINATEHMADHAELLLADGPDFQYVVEWDESFERVEVHAFQFEHFNGQRNKTCCSHIAFTAVYAARPENEPDIWHLNFFSYAGQEIRHNVQQFLEAKSNAKGRKMPLSWS